MRLVKKARHPKLFHTTAAKHQNILGIRGEASPRASIGFADTTLPPLQRRGMEYRVPFCPELSAISPQSVPDSLTKTSNPWRVPRGSAPWRVLGLKLTHKNVKSIAGSKGPLGEVWGGAPKELSVRRASLPHPDPVWGLSSPYSAANIFINPSNISHQGITISAKTHHNVTASRFFVGKPCISYVDGI